MEPHELGGQLRGNVPARLPSGFGLVGAWGEGEGALGTAMWADGSCRLIWITIYPDGQLARGPKLGDWVVSESGPNGCGNAILGQGRCLTYDAAVDGTRVQVSMMGVERDEGDGVVLSIAT